MTLQTNRPPRRLPVGAEAVAGGRTHLRVWAPDRKAVAAVLEDGSEHALEAEEGGYFSGFIPGGAGTLYRLLLDGKDGPFPDPVSRFQPEGVHGPSQVVDPDAFAWSDADWRGVPLDEAVIYEMHIGTFTPEGTWAAAIERLPELADLGITVLEVMPVADFAGEFGWGYDGVDLFAPTRLYGTPDDMRAFVDAAHRIGLAVILDVVYNHIGPSGNYLTQFAKSWFTDAHECEWGDAINYDGPGSDGVREFVVSNARYWIDEYHMDGLRLDATQQIFDDSDEHVLVELGRAVREAGGDRITLLVTENEPQDAEMVRPVEAGGYGLDTMWNDDFHHSAMVALTGRSEAYFSDHCGTPQELLSCAKWGFLFQGQRYAWQEKRRGAPALDLPPQALVNFLQNHDQIANSALGLRGTALTDPASWRAMTALFLLMPSTPMLFQGQEYGASQPFLYFADHEPELARLVEQGRKDFLEQFLSIGSPGAGVELPRPHDRETFERCRLDPDERHREDNKRIWRMHCDLLRLRREDSELRPSDRRQIDGAVLGPDALLLRWFGEAGDDRLFVFNIGRDIKLEPAPEPLLAPPAGRSWTLAWSSEDPRYGGAGVVPPETPDGRWRLGGRSAALLRAEGTSEGRRS